MKKNNNRVFIFGLSSLSILLIYFLFINSFNKDYKNKIKID